jgi:hypothetical protein
LETSPGRGTGAHSQSCRYYATRGLIIFTDPAPAILLIWFRIGLLNYYNLCFAIPSILYGLVVFRLWSRTNYSLAVAQVGVIQQYAYLSAMIDRVVGTSFEWVPSGEGKAHKSNRYRNYRLFPISWTFPYQSLFITGAAYQIILGHVWYKFLPL